MKLRSGDRMRDAFERRWKALIEDVADGAHPLPSDGNSYSAIFNTFDIPAVGIPEQQYLDHLATHVVPFAAPVSSPRCFGHMTSAVPGILRPVAELALALNQNMVKREASRVLTMLERQSIAQVHRLVYYLPLGFYQLNAQAEASTLGIVTSGGTSSNITALWVARNHCLPPVGIFRGIEEQGIAAAFEAHNCRRAVIIGSALMHYSIDKAAGLLGLGEDACIKIPVDTAGRVDVIRLRHAVENCREQGDRIVAIVGVAGTTDLGSIDPLDELADIADEAEAYFHVDAAWGAPFLFSRRYAALLNGIHRAASVTIDGHKQMHLPISNSLVVFRNPKSAEVIEKRARYMLRPRSGDLGTRSLEGSRPCSTLLLHAALHLIGRRGYEQLMDASIAMARFMASQIRARAGFELLTEPQTNIVVYRYIYPEWRSAAERRELTREQNSKLNSLNERIQRRQADAGRFAVSRTTIDCPLAGSTLPVLALRAVIANPKTTEPDIIGLLEEQAAMAEEFSVSSPVAGGM